MLHLHRCIVHCHNFHGVGQSFYPALKLFLVPNEAKILNMFSKQKLETSFISHCPEMTLCNPKKYNLIGNSANNILLADLKCKQFLGIFPHDDIILQFYSIHRR